MYTHTQTHACPHLLKRSIFFFWEQAANDVSRFRKLVERIPEMHNAEYYWVVQVENNSPAVGAPEKKNIFTRKSCCILLLY